MRKTILLLINGFGIERKDSVEVYTKDLMPNMDFMTKNYLFSSLVANAGDYNNGYKDFSMYEDKKKEDEIDNIIFEKKLNDNPVFKDILSKLTHENKLHIFYNLNDGSKLHQIREIIKVINQNKDKKVFIHIVLTGTSISEYDGIIKAISKLAFETNSYAKVGFVVGSDKFNTDDVLRTFYKEFGEYWNESTKKFEILKGDIVNPKDVNVFHVNKGFSLGENDLMLFANFSNINYDKFLNDISKIPLYKCSLYPFREDIPNAFQHAISDVNSISDIALSHNIKLLALTNDARINQLNYYLNGMKKVLNPNIIYAEYQQGLFSSKDNVISLVENNNYDGIIIDFDIGSLVNLEEIRQVLRGIDIIVKPISEACLQKDYTFIISSNYGMHAQVNDGVVTKVVNFAGKVPCIYQNNEFVKGKYNLVSGTTHDLALTFLTNICDEVKSNKLIKKLSGLDKVLSKKR